jgi:hypothetical protein
VAAPRANRAFVWFIIGLIFISLGFTKRRNRPFFGVGLAFVAIGFVQSRRTKDEG